MKKIILIVLLIAFAVAGDIDTNAYYKDNQLKMGCQLAFKYAANMNDFDYYPKAYSLAKKLINKYPKHKDFYSCYDTLSYLYQQGSYISQDYLKAVKILKRSYQVSKDIYKGNLATQIAELYLTKLQDDKNATLWYKKAHEHTRDKTLLTRVEAYKKSLLSNKQSDLNTTRKSLPSKTYKDLNAARQQIYPIIDTFAIQEQFSAFLESQKYYFIATDQKSIKIYDKKSLTFQKELSGWIGNGVAGMITQMAYDEQRKLLYVTPIFSATDISKNNTILAYDITTGKVVKTIKNPNAMSTTYLNISRDGKYLVAINNGTMLNIINTDTHEIQHYIFANIASFTQANIERNGDDYFVNVLGKDNFLYTFSVKQQKNIAKVPFTHQTAFKPLNTAHAFGIFGNRIYPIKNVKLKKNNLFIQDTQGALKKFDLLTLTLSEANTTINFPGKHTSNIHIEYKDKNTSIEIYRDKKRIGDIAFYTTPVLAHKIVQDKYVVITTNDMSSMFVFNLSGRPIAKLIGFNALQTHITYQEGYLITYGKDDIIHLWDMKHLDTYNKLPEQYNKEMLKGMNRLTGGAGILQMLNASDDDIRKIMQLNHLPYKLAPRQFRSYLKMMLLKKVPIYPLGSLYIKQGKDWILYTHQGLFAYGSKGKDLLKYHQNRGRYEEARIVENDRLFKKFYRPDLIRDLLAGRPVTLPVDVKSVLLNIKPPTLRLLDHTMLNERDVELTYQVCNAGNGVANPRLLINGQAINPPNARGFRIEKIKHAHKKCTTFRSVLTLDPGTNTIAFKAYDHGKNIANSSPILKIVANYIMKNRTKTPTPPIAITDASQSKGDLYFLAIAIDTYQKSAYNLKYSIQDAKAVEERYLAGNKHTFNHIHTYHLYDQNVTKENVADMFDAISRTIRYGDTFLLYLAGHGTYKNGKYLFVPYEVHKKFSIDFLKENFAKIYTDKYLVLLDTCRSGAAMDKLYDEATTNRLAHDSAKVNYIVSSSADQVAIEGYKDHGVFTYSVVNAFQNHPALTVFQLADILTDEVPRISLKTFHFRQMPQVKLNRDFPLIHFD